MFVAAHLASDDGRKQLRERSKTSAGQYNINTEALASIRIPDVPHEQQQAFAASVSAAMAQRARVTRLAAADDELFASLQSRAFDGRL
jgi:type I restriction enzyme S subunit